MRNMIKSYVKELATRGYFAVSRHTLSLVGHLMMYTDYSLFSGLCLDTTLAFKVLRSSNFKIFSKWESLARELNVPLDLRDQLRPTAYEALTTGSRVMTTPHGRS